MTTLALSSHAPAQTQRNERQLESRLKAMDDKVFLRLTCQDRFETVSSAPAEWNEQQLRAALARGPELAADPAKGGKINDGSLEEAAVALTAEHQKALPKLTRETSGSAEFIDANGVAWDVKSPLSPPPGQNWSSSPEHQITKIRHDLGQGDKVLFNLSRVNEKDRDATLALMQEKLSCQERSQLLILTDPEVSLVG